VKNPGITSFCLSQDQKIPGARLIENPEILASLVQLIPNGHTLKGFAIGALRSTTMETLFYTKASDLFPKIGPNDPKFWSILSKKIVTKCFWTFRTKNNLLFYTNF
jgi:hypothetical protein